MTKAQADGLAVYHVVVKIDPHCAMPIAGRQLIHNALAAVGQVIAVHPDAKSPAASKQVEFVLASAQTVQQITAKGRIPTISEEVTIELMLEPSAAPQTAATATRTGSRNFRGRESAGSRSERAGSSRPIRARSGRLPPRRKTCCAWRPAASIAC